MAKTIKFNLLLDDNPVRDIETLQNNFCIDDILEVYENGLLQKWLKVRGFDEYLEKVENITKEGSITVELIKIFDIKKDDAEIRESIYSLEFQEERKKDLKNFNLKDSYLKNGISKYHKEYEELIEAIIEKKENMAFLKVASKEISDKYLKLFELDYKDSYELYKEKSPLMIYAILMNDKLSYWFMKNEIIKKDLYSNLTFIKIQQRYQKDTNYEWIKVCDEPVEILNIYQSSNWVYIDKIKHRNNEKSEFTKDNAIGKTFNELYFSSYSSSDYIDYIKINNKNNLEFYTGITDSYWKDLETSDIKVMILSIPDGTFIRSANDLKQELSAEEINGNFLILDGLAYKSNNDYDSIVYMKV